MKTYAPIANDSWHRLQHFRHMSFSLYDMRNSQDKFEDLEVLILRFIDQECHDPKDKIYGLLSLANYPGPWEIEADYTKTNRQVYDQVMEVVCDSARLHLPWKRQYFAKTLLNELNLSHLESEILVNPSFSSYSRYFT